MKISDIIQEDIASVVSTADLSTMLAAVREEMEAVDDASMDSREGDANAAAASWARDNGVTGSIEVYPEMQ